MFYFTSLKTFVFCLVCLYFTQAASAQNASAPQFKVIAFYTGKEDQAHISFVQEAGKWFPAMAKKYNFTYDATNNWGNLNTNYLANYQVVIFLDTRPEDPLQRAAFEKYMKSGGAWMGFHFAAFALNQSAVPQNWDWYHNTFLGSGQYGSNTWRPTSAVLKVENSAHPAMKGQAATFKASPNEWYRWEKDLTKNPDIQIMASIDPASFPLGTGPKQSEIWHSGYYPVVWTNKNYKMIYFNMGHNDIDYEHHTNKDLSHTFGNPAEDKLILNALLWLGGSK
ncbi:ThuA domain-containing protein [Mucilaginibacter phyllosphaerae]|uniref:ThuA domain-containing protein n=1 Tax=Mucilaginibacter phyllosphaerae TaxID=1812349 RepID=A0A4Y8AFZ0_9SPHI|nr:ThuA domain-containing protein [Mucilaginibacter phyllosphaerae]MBB3968690.1 hypothetical protein [Mucilaginibacter phyllosphaerae]TEW67673.1 ThuA domain-containing protein [Mucilaginibacter phyllosphaerae]GGH14452.1 hypothetical protein GCM10007352_22590 [Mucilaginibacter phyllosphaerae]